MYVDNLNINLIFYMFFNSPKIENIKGTTSFKMITPD